MKIKQIYIAIILAVLVVLPALGFIFLLGEKYKKEIPLSNERELKVDLEAGYGNITVEKGVSSQLFSVDIDADLKKDASEYIDYSNRDQTGYLSINTTEALKENRDKKKHSLHISGFEDNNWLMRFTDSVPISFDIELGMGKGDFNLSGLRIKDLNLSTGASSVALRFDEPNQTSIENITIETGLSKFKAYGLSNSNFENLKFEGGVGSYLLDFSGKLDREADVDIQIGLGSITLIIPNDIGAKVYYEKSWVASIDLPNDFVEKEDNNYFSKNYYSGNGRLNLHIEAGLGSVTIKHR
jgi:hypothetical protein